MGQDKYVDLLTPMKKKMEIFESMGVNHTYIVTFDASLMRLSPEQFVDQVLDDLALIASFAVSILPLVFKVKVLRIHSAS